MRPKPPRFKVGDKVRDSDAQPRVVVDVVRGHDRADPGWVPYAAHATRYTVDRGYECHYKRRHRDEMKPISDSYWFFLWQVGEFLAYIDCYG